MAITASVPNTNRFTPEIIAFLVKNNFSDQAFDVAHAFVGSSSN